ncbi:RidA family protein [Oricola indica]|uniref:RidA family protein n=1 Tax=Oricola indica TaxID=2872591 RepID=UPI003CCBE3B2
MKLTTDPEISGPFGPYSHAALIPHNCNVLAISGLVGCDANGMVPESPKAQATLIFESLSSLLTRHGLGTKHMAKLNLFVTNRAHLADIRGVRDNWLKDHRPAMSLILVAGLGNPDWHIEVDGFAAFEPRAEPSA